MESMSSGVLYVYSPAKGCTSCQCLRQFVLLFMLRFETLWDGMCCSAVARGKVFAVELCQACRSVRPVKVLPEVIVHTLVSSLQGAVFVSKNANHASIIWSVSSHSTNGMVEQFCSLALHVSSIPRRGPTWLQHTKRFCIALPIICQLSTTFIHDCA